MIIVDEKEEMYNAFVTDLRIFLKKIMNIIYYSIILLIHVPPNVNYSYAWTYLGYVNILNLYAIVLALSFLSFPFILKTAVSISRWNSINARYISNNEYSRNDFIFFIKCEFKHRPMFICFLIFIIFTIIVTFTLRIFESGTVTIKDSILVRNKLELFWNSMDFIIFTITSVGYGNFVPKSLIGKIIAAICCLLGNAVIGLFIASVAVTSEFSSNEKKAFETLKALKLDEDLKQKAGDVILNIFIFRKLVRIKDRARNSSLISPKKKISGKSLFKKIIKEKSTVNLLDLKKSNISSDVKNDKVFKNHFLQNTFHAYSKIINHSKILFNFFTIINHVKKSANHFKNEDKISKMTAFIIDDNLKKIESSMENFLYNLKVQVSKLETAVDKVKESHYDLNVCHERMKNVNFMNDKIFKYIAKINNLNIKYN